MKKLVQQLLAKFGYAIRRTHTLQGGDPGSAARPIGHIKSFLDDIHARGFNPRGIIDVGANKGEWTKIAISVFPTTPILMIEPQDEMEPFLQNLAQATPDSHFIKAGAGRKAGELFQTIWEDSEGSSFLPPVNSELQRAGKQRKTRIVTIDDVLEREYPKFTPDLVKMDIQGFELEALSGAETLFGKTEMFILEVSLFSSLPDCPIAREVISFMSARGYELYDVCGACRRPLDGALAQLDLSFVKAAGIFRKTADW